MRERLRKPNMGGVLALLLFGVFAVCILSVLLTGADAYRRLSARDRDSFDRRTAAQYLTTRVRQGDRAGLLWVEEFGGGTALVLAEDIDGERYLTRVYCWDGAVRELFSAADGGFSPEDGEILMAAQRLCFSLEGSLLTVELTAPSGTCQRLTLYLRSGEGAAA